jgi:chemosensory pili system protein ChpA (sensor histidine kinase/response regulator)
VLLQYVWLAKGTEASARLAEDLLFLCSQAKVQRAADSPVLSAVRTAYGLKRFKPVDYESLQFGRFAPALIAQARKRIASAKETWSVGDRRRPQQIQDADRPVQPGDGFAGQAAPAQRVAGARHVARD